MAPLPNIRYAIDLSAKEPISIQLRHVYGVLVSEVTQQFDKHYDAILLLSMNKYPFEFGTQFNHLRKQVDKYVRQLKNHPH